MSLQSDAKINLNMYNGFIKQKFGQMNGNDQRSLIENPYRQRNRKSSNYSPNKFSKGNEGSNSKSPLRRVTQKLKIAIICAGQMFGHEDVLNNRDCTTTIKCLSNNAQLYCIKAEEFTHRLSRDDRTWNIL